VGAGSQASEMIPVDYNSIYPELNGFLLRPLLVNPPMCTFAELSDGTYTIYDIEIINQIIEIQKHINIPSTPLQTQSGGIYG
jgi:hypothetical protein